MSTEHLRANKMAKQLAQDQDAYADTIAAYKLMFEVDGETASKMIRVYDRAYREGVRAGQAEAQRFFRLALGIEAADIEEAAYWNNPVPLKQATPEQEVDTR